MKKQGLEWIVYDTPIQLEVVEGITTPPSGIARLAAKLDGGVVKLFYKRPDGTEVELGAGGLAGSGESFHPFLTMGA